MLSDQPTGPPNLSIFPHAQPGNFAAPDQVFEPNQLAHLFLDDPRAADRAGKIFVMAASYRKVKTGAEHEFLIFEVKDKDKGFTNYIKIDRCPAREPLVPPRSVNDILEGAGTAQEDPTSRPNMLPSDSDFSKDKGPLWGTEIAADRVRISGSGTRKSLLETRKESDSIGEMLMGSSAHELTLEGLLMLAAEVSSHSPKYHILESQCYWYANTIWELLKAIGPDWEQEEGTMERAGQHTMTSWMKWHEHSGPDSQGVVRNVGEMREAILEKYRVNWEEFKSELERVVAEARRREAEVIALSKKDEELRKKDEAEARRREAEVVALSKKDEELRKKDEELRKKDEELRKKDEAEARRREAEVIALSKKDEKIRELEQQLQGR